MVNEDELLWRERFSSRVLAEMKKQNISQKMLAEDTGINASSISYYVRGKKTPTFPCVVAISESLNVKLDEFL